MNLFLDYWSLSLLNILTSHTAKMSTRKSGLLVWSTVSYFKETSTLWPKASKIFQDKEPIYLFHIIHWIYHMLDFIYLFLKYETMLFTCARWRAVSPPTFALSVFALVFKTLEVVIVIISLLLFISKFQSFNV